jgi:excisionase family DNA binding protein
MVVAFDKRPAGLLTIAEAAILAGVHRNTIRAWCAAGRLPSVRVNRRGERRVRREDVRRVLDERSGHVGPPSPVGPGKSRERHRGQGDAPAKPPPPAAARDDPVPSTHQLKLVRDQVDRAEALRRIAAEISGAANLDSLFDDVLASSVELFGCDRAALWLYDPTAHRPLRLAAQHQLPDDLALSVAQLQAGSPAAGMAAIHDRSVTVLADLKEQSNDVIRAMYERAGIATVCFVPVVFRDEPLGLLVLYHETRYAWTADERQLARSFADGMAAAIGSARLYDSVQSLAARLDAIQELAVRLNRIHDVAEIGAAIVGETGRLLDYDTIRVYRVDAATRMCEPIAFHGRFLGEDNPAPERLRVAVGKGLTGWVAEHNQTLRVGDAAADQRGIIVGDAGTPESMLLVPMSFEDRVCGVIVVSKLGQDRFDADDETTLSIFAGYAAQALVNAENVVELRLQRA